jgi:plastocyanin
MKKLSLALSVLALAAFGLAACGDDDEDTDATTEATTETTTAAGGGGGGGAGGTVSFTADSGGALAYEEDSASVPAGEVTIEFDNPSSTPHDVVIEDSGGEVARTDVISGDTTSTSAELAAGEYTFYCSVDGHRTAGMEGTLTVE